MIDLHLHTTASDGSSTPAALVDEAMAAGLSTIAVTDHDTMAGLPAVVDAARALPLTVVPGIEITAVERGRDLHVLGYFIDPDHSELRSFLSRQREDRRRRVVAIGERLAAAGAPIDIAPILAHADSNRAVGRLMVAMALVEAGHVADVPEAFDRYLGPGQPAFVERMGREATAVVTLIARAGGLASLAHPGKTGRDDLIPALADAGLAAIEVFHPDHDAADTARYGQLAAEFGLAVTGGSDYHGPQTRRAAAFGHVHLPADAYARFVARRQPRS